MGQKTDLNHLSIDNLKEENESKTNLSLVSIGNIKIPIYGLADKSNEDIPFSYIFLPPRKMWPNLFAKMMKDEVGKKKNNFSNDFSNYL